MQGRCAGEPESFCGGNTDTECLVGSLPEERGVRMNESWLHDRTEEMGGGTLRPPRDKKTSLSLDVKRLFRESEMALLLASTEKCRQKA